MLNALIRFSLAHRLLIIATFAFVVVAGGFAMRALQVDVFPDLNRPVVTVFAEAHGLAPEEIEVLVAAPIEAAVNGAPDVERVRSVSSAGLALVFVEFHWNSDPYRNRQVVAERLQLAAARLPADVLPTLGPITSIMGEIMLIGVKADPAQVSPMDLRSLADWTLRPRLLSVPGVAQVTTIGGDVKQYQVLVDPYQLARLGVSLTDVELAVASANTNTAGGYLETGPREFVIRNLGRVSTLEELGASVVTTHDGVPVLLRDVATVKLGAQPKRGDASVNAQPAVILSIQKQPGADTVALTEQIEQALVEIRTALPAGVEVQSTLFRQADFISSAVTNVEHALRDGSIIVAIVLLLFLLNFRATIITLTAIPLSFLTAATVLSFFGASVNTMTLGGLAIAVGELVDDAIVDVENVLRRLRENRHLPNPRPILEVVYAASSEIRGSIVYATIIVILAFMPLFFLQGLEGRLLAPLGLAYVISLTASLVVSLTLTPVLCSYLLPHAKATQRRGDTPIVRRLKAWDLKLLNFSLDRPWRVISAAAAVFVLAVGTVTLLGREFLPPFNESSITVNVIAPPGTSLEESNRLGREAEEAILLIEDVQSTGRRTGRAELDEHAEGVHYSEIEVVPTAESEQSNREVMDVVRSRLVSMTGIELNIGQPISHRIDHLLSGVQAQVAIKVFGPELSTLRTKAEEVRTRIARIPGVVDLSVEKQTAIPQVQIGIRREATAQYGVQVGQVAEALATALNGRIVSNVLEGQASFAAVVRLAEPYRGSVEDIGGVLLDGPGGAKIPLAAVADVRTGTGPNQILRENGQRRIVVQCNVSGRDLGSVVDDIRQAVNDTVALDPGFFITYGGQFESQQRATRLILLLSLCALGLIFLVLYAHFRSAMITLQIMMNVPMAFIGGVVAVLLSGGTLSVASLVGFVTLAGIASRNGIMMISHYLHLMQHEGETFGRPMIIRGSLERLVPVLMTALATGLALLPLAFAAGEAGKEILQPVALVILGGLLSSTLLDQAVTPALFYVYGRRLFEPKAGEAPVWEFAAPSTGQVPGQVEVQR
jgi:CzcA family heavy metal efflux pump